MNKKPIFLDLDGVILNSEELILQQKEKKKEISWDDFFSTVDWDTIYKESKPINNSIEIIKELEARKEELVILTKIHTLNEMNAKVYDLRNNREIETPILFVPPHVKKSEIYIPNNNEILVDDSLKNINDWDNKGGEGILFDINANDNEKQKVKSLEFLL